MAWFAYYLTNRYQVTKVNQTISDHRAITCGVPQGSILALLLFTIYINDLPQIISNAYINLYANDTMIAVLSKDIAEIKQKVNVQLKAISEWFNANMLSLNHKKSNFMIFSTNPRIRNYSSVRIGASDKQITGVDSYK